MKNLSLIFFLIGLTYLSKAQNGGGFNSLGPTPTAAGLAQYVKTPVSPRTGGELQEKAEEFILKATENLAEGREEIDYEYALNISSDIRDHEKISSLFLQLAEGYYIEMQYLKNKNGRPQIFATLFDKGVLTQIATNFRYSQIAAIGSFDDPNSTVEYANSNNLTYFDLSTQWSSLSERERSYSIQIFIDTQKENCGSFYYVPGKDCMENEWDQYMIEMIISRGYEWVNDNELKLSEEKK